MHSMQHQYSPSPAKIARANAFTAGESRFYLRLYSLMKKQGYCPASNETLAEYMGRSPRQIRSYIKKFRDEGMIVVDIEDGWKRKIWKLESWEAECRKKSNLRFGSPIPPKSEICHGGGWKSIATNIYNTKCYIDSNFIHKDICSKSIHSFEREATLLRFHEEKNRRKIPDKPPNLEITDEGKRWFLERVDKKYYEPVLESVRKHLKISRPGSKYHKMPIQEAMFAFHLDNERRRLAVEEATKKQTKPKLEKRKVWFSDVIALNPHTKKDFSLDPQCAILFSNGVSCFSVDYGRDDFEERVEQRLEVMQRATGHVYRLPGRLGN